MTPLVLFCSAFFTVFLLGIQQQNVIGRHYAVANLNAAHDQGDLFGGVSV